MYFVRELSELWHMLHHQYTHRENMPGCYSQADCPGQVRSSCCICETCSTHTNVMFHGWSEFWHTQVFARIANRLMFDICRTNNYSFESLSSTKRFTETHDSTPAHEDIATRVPTTNHPCRRIAGRMAWGHVRSSDCSNPTRTNSFICFSGLHTTTNNN